MLDLSVSGMRERMLLLRALPTMSGLDEEGYATVASHTMERIVQPGDVLLRENEPIKSGFMVIDGMIEVRRQGYVTARIDRGGVGFLSVLARDPRGAEAIATKRSRVLELPVDALWDAYEENFSFLRNALRLTAGNLLAKRDSLPKRADEGTEPAMGEWYDRPRTMVERIIQATETAPIWAGMNLDAVIDWARSSQEVRMEPGELLWKLGDLGTHSFMVDYGRVRCTTADGRTTVVGHQYVLGSLDPLCNRPRSYEAIAETKVIGLKVAADDWMTTIETHPKLGFNLLRALATQLLHLQLEDAKREVAKAA